MRAAQWRVVCAVFAILGLGALSLLRLQEAQRLGAPGVKLRAIPTYDSEGNVVNTNSADLPEYVLDFKSEALPISDVVLGYLPKDTTYGSRRYVAPDGFLIDANVVLMGMDRSSIHKPQICLVGQGWKIDKTETVRLPMEQPRQYDLTIKKLTASKSFRNPDGEAINLRAVYVYWFVAENLITAEHGTRMWWTARDLVMKKVLDRFAYISFLSLCYPGQEDETFERMQKLIQAAVPKFQRAVGSPSAMAGNL